MFTWPKLEIVQFRQAAKSKGESDVVVGLGKCASVATSVDVTRRENVVQGRAAFDEAKTKFDEDKK